MVSLFLACSLTVCKIAIEKQNLLGDCLIVFWILFNLFVVAMLALDLGVFHRRAHEVRFREALAWSVMWIALAAAFAALIFFWRGRILALEFVTGYVIELSLSVDNLFVFLLIFRYFRVPGEDQHKVLFWGIIGALIMRAVFILLGVSLIRRFHWIVYVFGALLVYSGSGSLARRVLKSTPRRIRFSAFSAVGSLSLRITTQASFLCASPRCLRRLYWLCCW